tara:strand:+ start:13726 stop:13947 length:222 start_codon:yes stop_codon:yes gene_type:complete
MDIEIYQLSYEDGVYCVGTKAEVIHRHNVWVEQSGRFELDEIDDNLATTIQELAEHWTVEVIYTVKLKLIEDK